MNDDAPQVPIWATRLLAARTAREWSQRDLARELIKASDKPLTSCRTSSAASGATRPANTAQTPSTPRSTARRSA